MAAIVSSSFDGILFEEVSAGSLITFIEAVGEVIPLS
jgi:hypothetical protein